MKTLCSLLLLLSAVTIQCTSGNGGASTPQRFNCREKGNFPIPGSCHEYIECFEWRGLFYPRPTLCPQDQYFDQTISACRRVSVTTPPECSGNSQVADTAGPKVDTLRKNNPPSSIDVDPSEDTGAALEEVRGNQTPGFSTSGDAPEITSAVRRNQTPGFSTGSDTSAIVSAVRRNQTPDFSTGGDAPEITSVNRDDVQTPGISIGSEIVSDVREDTSENVQGINITLNNGSTEHHDDVEDMNIVLGNGTTTEATTTTMQTPYMLTLCDHLNFVTRYATLLIGTPDQKQSLDYEKNFNELSKTYNLILEKAQNNSIVWKNGDSIFIGIKKTYNLAAEYEGEFNRKYTICQEQIKKRTGNEEIIPKLRQDIGRLQEEIRQNEQALSMSTSDLVREYFENSIKSKQQEIHRKQEEIASSSKASLQLREVLQFLEYVKDDASEVESLAKHLQIRIDALSNNYASDMVSLQMFANRVNEGVQSLTAEAESTEGQLTNNTNRQQDLESSKKDLDAETDKLNAEHSKTMATLRKLDEEMEEKRNKFKEISEKICRPDGPIKLKLKRTSTDEEKAKACNELLEAHNVRLDITRELAESQRLRKRNERKRSRIYEIIAEIDVFNQELRQLLGAAPLSKIRLQKIRSELGNMQRLQDDLLVLTTTAKEAMSSLTAIGESIQTVYTSFEPLTKQFNIMLAQGRAANTDQDKQQERVAIEQQISEIVQTIQQTELSDLEICT